MLFLFAGREPSSHQGIQETIVGIWQRNPNASQNEIRQRTACIGTGR
jgi:hypothetical protein